MTAGGVVTEEEKTGTDQRDGLGLFAARVGNEINNPLAAVLAAQQYLRARIDADPTLAADARIRRFFEMMETELGEATRIVSDLLEFGAPRRLSRSTFLLHTVVRDAAARVPRAPTVKLEDHIDEALPPVHLDAHGVQVAVGQLVRNAAQAVANGGTITLNARIDGGVVEIEIVDDGPGMAPDTVARALDPLFSAKAKGLGLGLPIADAVARAHGGALECKSTLGAGTTVVMRLPLA